jgi:hypothetical protein
MMMTYEGVTLDNGLQVKNGKIVTEAQFDYAELKAKIDALQTKQPWTLAKIRAREEAMSKRRK